MLSLAPNSFGEVQAAIEKFRDLDDPHWHRVAPDLDHFFENIINRAVVPPL